jgi:hypothetical protein
MADRPTILDLGDLGLERSAQVLLKRALRSLPVGGRLVIRGASRELEAHLAAWCRMQGHLMDWVHDRGEAVVVRGAAEEGRWRGPSGPPRTRRDAWPSGSLTSRYPNSLLVTYLLPASYSRDSRPVISI